MSTELMTTSTIETICAARDAALAKATEAAELLSKRLCGFLGCGQLRQHGS